MEGIFVAPHFFYPFVFEWDIKQDLRRGQIVLRCLLHAFMPLCNYLSKYHDVRYSLFYYIYTVVYTFLFISLRTYLIKVCYLNSDFGGEWEADARAVLAHVNGFYDALLVENVLFI